MSIIGVDIDDTLYSFGDAARSAAVKMAKETGDNDYMKVAYASQNDWRGLADAHPDPKAIRKVIERVHDDEILLSREPYEGAVDVVTALSDAGHTLLYASNRDTEREDATHQWLMIHGFPAGDLKCHYGPKDETLRECQYIIDDRPRTLVQFVYDFDWQVLRDTQRLGFALWKPYNQNLTDVPGIYLAPTWEGIRYYLVQKGIIPNEDC